MNRRLVRRVPSLWLPEPVVRFDARGQFIFGKRLTGIVVGGGGDIQAVFRQSDTGSGDFVTTMDLPFPSNVLEGSLLVAVWRPSNGAHCTVTSTPSLSWSEAAYSGNPVSEWSVGISWARATAAGAMEVHISGSAGDAQRAAILEYEGPASSYAVVDTDAGEGTSSNPNLGTVTTMATNTLIVCASGSDTSHADGSWGAGSGFALREISDEKLGVEDRNAATAGNYDGTFSNSFNDSYGGVTVAFKGT